MLSSIAYFDFLRIASSSTLNIFNLSSIWFPEYRIRRLTCFKSWLFLFLWEKYPIGLWIFLALDSGFLSEIPRQLLIKWQESKRKQMEFGHVYKNDVCCLLFLVCDFMSIFCPSFRVSVHPISFHSIVFFYYPSSSLTQLSSLFYHHFPTPNAVISIQSFKVLVHLGQEQNAQLCKWSFFWILNLDK